MDLQTGEMNTDLGAGKKMLLCVFKLSALTVADSIFLSVAL